MSTTVIFRSSFLLYALIYGFSSILPDKIISVAMSHTLYNLINNVKYIYLSIFCSWFPIDIIISTFSIFVHSVNGKYIMQGTLLFSIFSSLFKMKNKISIHYYDRLSFLQKPNDRARKNQLDKNWIDDFFFVVFKFIIINCATSIVHSWNFP